MTSTLTLPGFGSDAVDEVDDQHQGTPYPVAAMLARLTGLCPPRSGDRRAVFPVDLAAAPSTALAPRWGGQQLDGSLLDVLSPEGLAELAVPAGWWMNPPFGAVCITCGGGTPTPTKKGEAVCLTCSGVSTPTKKGAPGCSKMGHHITRKGGSPGCSKMGHRIVRMVDWAKLAMKLARGGRPGVVLCKLDTSTEWWRRLMSAAVARVDFIDGRVQYLTAVDGELRQRRGADFCSTAVIVGPVAAGYPPVIYATTSGEVLGMSPGAKAALADVQRVVAPDDDPLPW